MSKMNRFKECSFRAPSSSKTIKNETVSCCASWYVKLFAKLRQTSSFSTNSQNVISSCVSLLMLARFPLTVFRAIAQIIIHALKGHSSRARTHIIKKISEVLPSFAHIDSTASINKEFWISLVHTSGNHTRPFLVFFRFGTSVLGSAISILAPARKYFAIFKMRISNYFYLPAITQANAHSFSPRCSANRIGVPQNKKPSKSLIDNINFSSHGGIMTELQFNAT